MNMIHIERQIETLDRQCGAQAKACSSAMRDWLSNYGDFGLDNPVIVQDTEGTYSYCNRNYVSPATHDLVAELLGDTPFEGFEPVTDKDIPLNAWAWTAMRWLNDSNRGISTKARLPSATIKPNIDEVVLAARAVDACRDAGPHGSPTMLCPIFGRQGNAIVYGERESLNSAIQGHHVLAFGDMARTSEDKATASIYLLSEASRVLDASRIANRIKQQATPVRNKVAPF